MINTITRAAAGLARGLLISLIAALPVAAQNVPTDLGSLTVQNAMNSLATPQANDLVPLYRGQNGVLNFSRYSAVSVASSIVAGTTVVSGTCTPNTLLEAAGSPLVVQCITTLPSGLTLSDPVNIGSGPAIISSPAAAQFQYGAVDAAAPIAQLIRPQSVVAGTTNTAGVDFTLAGSKGTGTGIGGKFLFQLAPAGSAGTAQNAYVTSFQIIPSATGTTVLPFQMRAGSSGNNPQFGAIGQAWQAIGPVTIAGTDGGANYIFSNVTGAPAGTLTFTASAGNPNITSGSGTTNFVGTITVASIAANTGAQTGYLCYNTAGGVITYDGTSTCLVSSARFKENIEKLVGSLALEEVLKLAPASFNRRASPDTAQRLGLIAEEVAEVDERLVVRGADGLPRGVLYETGVVALLVGSIKELKGEIDELKRLAR